MHEFRCPHCAIPLRVRDDSFRNRTIPCPECKQPVLIQESAQGLIGVPTATALAMPASHPPASRTLPSRTARWIAIGTAVFLAGGVLLFLVMGPDRSPEPASVPAADTASIAPPAAAEPAVLPAIPPPAPPAVIAEVEDQVAVSLQGIDQLLRPGVDRLGHFPHENTGGKFSGPSWIARLAEPHLPERQVHWEAGWNAPVNDEFVRRRFPAFENPQVPRKTGDDNYPATHFVGVGGIGNDAPTLPKSHPRAGIFSGDAPTRPADVKDGLSNTMLIAGVESHLGSWASPGRASVRSFTREPYLHGPDGFGTGDPDRMLVLMADGSVRELSAATDPVLVRRMAAMADGIPLDPQRAGDPLTLTPAALTESMPVPVDPPILPELAPDIPVFDLKPRLAQKIALFEQLRPVPVAQVLFDLQELIGAPLDTSLLTEEIRSRPVQLKLQNVSVEEILQQLSTAAGISYSAAPQGIRFQPASEK